MSESPLKGLPKLRFCCYEVRSVLLQIEHDEDDDNKHTRRNHILMLSPNTESGIVLVSLSRYSLQRWGTRMQKSISSSKIYIKILRILIKFYQYFVKREWIQKSHKFLLKEMILSTMCLNLLPIWSFNATCKTKNLINSLFEPVWPIFILLILSTFI